MPINDYKTNPYYYFPGVVPVEGGKFGYSQNENTQRDYVNGQWGETNVSTERIYGNNGNQLYKREIKDYNGRKPNDTTLWDPRGEAFRTGIMADDVNKQFDTYKQEKAILGYDRGGLLDPRNSQHLAPYPEKPNQWTPSIPSVPSGQRPYRSLVSNEGSPSPQTEYGTLPNTGRQTGYMVPVPHEFVPSTSPSRVAPLDRNYLNPEPKKFDDGGEISRRYALDVLRATGSSNPESRKEYRALKKDARANGLSGQDMRLAARLGAIDRGIARIMPALSDDIIIEDESIDLPAVEISTLEIPADLGVEVKSLDDYIDMTGMSFSNAFGKARGYGLKEFIWNGKRYNTKLASPKPKSKPQPKPDSGTIIVPDTPGYPVYIPNDKSSFLEMVKAAMINNAPYMK